MGAMHKKIVWLASYPKSGNTWVRCFLDAYYLGEVNLNDIVCSVSDNIFTRFQVGDGSDIRQDPVDIQQLARPMALLRLVKAWNANNEASMPLFVKSHAANAFANGIEMLPLPLTHSTIHIVRDPRDTFLSFEKHMGIKDRRIALEAFFDKFRVLVDHNKAQVGDYISSWEHHTRSFLSCETHNIVHIRFEDMKADPLNAFAKILTHAGVSPDMDRVKTALDMVALEKLQAQEASGGFKEASPHGKFFGKGAVGGWKGELSEMDQRKIEKHCGAMMKHYGYLQKRRQVA